jgi:hypothetical protein
LEIDIDQLNKKKKYSRKETTPDAVMCQKRPTGLELSDIQVLLLK